MEQAINVILAGATGWAGSSLAKAVAAQPDMRFTAAISRKCAGRALGEALGVPAISTPVYASAAEALAQPCDVFVEYTKPDSAKANIIAALKAGAHVVVGTSGLSDADYAEIDTHARTARRGVLACGNFALTMVLLQKFAEMAAKYIPHVELIDYAKGAKVDAPSGTVGELAFRLGKLRQQPADVVPQAEVRGRPDTRGAAINGVQVHALRLPGFVLGVEAVFGMPDQRLHLRHEAGSSSQPYVDGALLAIRRVSRLTGVHRGLDTVMDF